MRLIQTGAAVLNQTPLAWNHNRDNIIAAIDAARSEGVQFLCLPELAITGYGCEDAFHSAAALDMSLVVLEEILPHTRGITTCIGLPLMHGKAIYNTVAVVADGKVAGFVPKQHLAGDGLHYEPRWFKAWPAGASDLGLLGLG